MNHFLRAAPEEISHANARFSNGTLHVYGVLKIRFSGKYTSESREFLARPSTSTCSFVDVGTWPWVKRWKFSFTEEHMAGLPHLLKWINRIAERLAVELGISENCSKDLTEASVSK